MSRRLALTLLCPLLWASLLVPPRAAAAPIRVVATIFPVGDMARQVGGDEVDVDTLLPAGADPHTFEPSPDAVRALERAQVVIRVGAGLDAWVNRFATSRAAVVVTATEGIALLDDPDHEGRGDPHVWLDPGLMRRYFIPELVAALSRVRPELHQRFVTAAAAYDKTLSALDRDIAAAAAHWSHHEYVAMHQAWRYFGRRYGLTQVGAVEESPGKEPSARSVARIIDAARAAHCRVVLAEPQSSRRGADVIASEIGGKVYLVDPLGGPTVPGRDSYVALMHYNLKVFSDALR
jgi:zinc transport system substrate-binding protein